MTSFLPVAPSFHIYAFTRTKDVVFLALGEVDRLGFSDKKFPKMLKKVIDTFAGKSRGAKKLLGNGTNDVNTHKLETLENIPVTRRKTSFLVCCLHLVMQRPSRSVKSSS
jgi:hypothetical protein